MIAHIEAQGSLLSMKVLGFKSSRSSFGSKRGIIRVFSRASRRRLMRFMARLKTRKIRASFLTLTITRIVSNETAKIYFKRFTARLRRNFPNTSAVWRMEFQERGAIHFHLLAFNLPFWKQKDLQATWEACTEEPMSICHIKLVHGARSVMAYISKYIAKPDERTEITSLEDGSYQHGSAGGLAGRFWGYVNKKLLPLGEVYTGVLTDRPTIKSLSSLCWSILGSDNPYNSLSFHLFCDNARWLCERAVEEGGCWFDEWEYTVKDHSSPHASYHPYTEHFSEQELSTKNVQALGRMSRPSEASSYQPCTSDWLEHAVLSFPARIASEFRNDGILVHIVPLSKGHSHASL